jgi:GntR family transcriptional regulator
MKKTGKTPKYQIICTDIINDIEKELLTPGMQIYSEKEIINKYSVSNTTARKVLQELEAMGWAVKIKGKGTFVRQLEITRSIDRILSYNRSISESGYKPSTKILFIEHIPEGFSLKINDLLYGIKGPALKLHRLHFADHIPMMLETSYIAVNLCPGIEKLDLEGALYDIYETKYKLQLTEIYQMMKTVMIDVGLKDFFNIHESIPGIHIDGVTFCGKGLVVEIERSIYRGDKYQFFVRATNKQAS